MKKLLCKVLDYWKARSDIRMYTALILTGVAIGYFVPAPIALVVIAALTAAEVGIYFYKK